MKPVPSRVMRAWLLCTLLALATVFAGGCASSARRPLCLATLPPGTATPLEGARGTLVVLIFLSPECPIANAMMPDILALSDEAKARGVSLSLVHTTQWPSDRELTEHARAFNAQGRVTILVDRPQELARRVGATVTPEGALLRLDGEGGFERLYLGRINDLYTAIGRRRAAATSSDLRDAMRAASEGRPRPMPQPKAIGCFIEFSAPSS